MNNLRIENELTPEDREALRVLGAELKHRSQEFRQQSLLNYTDEELSLRLVLNNQARRVVIDNVDTTMKDLKRYLGK